MKKKAKMNFANAIIIFCVAVSVVITAVVLWEYHRLNEVLPSGVLAGLLGFWGGELMIIALRQIFGSDIMTKINKTDEDYYP